MRPSDATPVAENFSESRRVARELGWLFGHVASTGSTNADLVAAARAGDRSAAVLTTDHQTAGRGRLDRSWHDNGAGQLMVSLRLPVDAEGASWVTGAVAAAARAAVAELGAPAGFKWPNDLMIEAEPFSDNPAGVVAEPVSGKLAGVLAEFVAGVAPVVVVGMGLNIDPPDIDGAASLLEAGIVTSRDVVLAAMLASLPDRLTDPELVRTELRDHSVTLGRRVRVERPGDELVGLAVDFDDDGRLVLDVGGSRHVVSVGDVVHLRPSVG